MQTWGKNPQVLNFCLESLGSWNFKLTPFYHSMGRSLFKLGGYVEVLLYQGCQASRCVGATQALGWWDVMDKNETRRGKKELNLFWGRKMKHPICEVFKLRSFKRTRFQVSTIFIEAAILHPLAAEKWAPRRVERPCLGWLSILHWYHIEYQLLKIHLPPDIC